MEPRPRRRLAEHRSGLIQVSTSTPPRTPPLWKKAAKRRFANSIFAGLRLRGLPLLHAERQPLRGGLSDHYRSVAEVFQKEILFLLLGGHDQLGEENRIPVFFAEASEEKKQGSRRRRTRGREKKVCDFDQQRKSFASARQLLCRVRRGRS